MCCCLSCWVVHSWFPLFSIAIATVTLAQRAELCPSFLHAVLLCFILSSLLAGGWRKEAYVRVSLFMPYCALGIHVDESGSPEERQSGDGTSFPESPHLNHVGITAAFQCLAPQRLALLMLVVFCALWSRTIWRSARNYCNSCAFNSEIWLQIVFKPLSRHMDLQTECIALICVLTCWSCLTHRWQVCTRSWRTCTQERVCRHSRVAHLQIPRARVRLRPTAALSLPSHSPLSKVLWDWHTLSTTLINCAHIQMSSHRVYMLSDTCQRGPREHIGFMKSTACCCFWLERKLGLDGKCLVLCSCHARFVAGTSCHLRIEIL